jgi:hypothetical protein
MSDIVYSDIPSYRSIKTLDKEEEYIDKDDYEFNLVVKRNHKLHRIIYSLLILMFLIVTYFIFIMKKPNTNTPIFVYILYGIFVFLFYLYYFKLSVIITEFILLFYGLIKDTL